ncbi:MAG: flavin reductase family protein [Aquabacterium sp.]
MTPSPDTTNASAPPAGPALRQGLGRFATGVTIITCASADGQRTGLTANSFASLSLDPPLILWSLRLASPSLAAFMAAPAFAVNVLAQSQLELSRRFASALPDKFAQGAWQEGLDGVPLLSGCAAVIECLRETHQPAGDHMLFIGRVRRMTDQAVAPLVFQSGHYRMLGEIL